MQRIIQRKCCFWKFQKNNVIFFNLFIFDVINKNFGLNFPKTPIKTQLDPLIFFTNFSYNLGLEVFFTFILSLFKISKEPQLDENKSVVILGKLQDSVIPIKSFSRCIYENLLFRKCFEDPHTKKFEQSISEFQNERNYSSRTPTGWLSKTDQGRKYFPTRKKNKLGHFFQQEIFDRC